MRTVTLNPGAEECLTANKGKIDRIEPIQATQGNRWWGMILVYKEGMGRGKFDQERQRYVQLLQLDPNWTEQDAIKIAEEINSALREERERELEKARQQEERPERRQPGKTVGGFFGDLLHKLEDRVDQASRFPGHDKK